MGLGFWGDSFDEGFVVAGEDHCEVFECVDHVFPHGVADAGVGVVFHGVDVVACLLVAKGLE